jgi:DNA-directed RNA polymerase subunit RPC12/RpoP
LNSAGERVYATLRLSAGETCIIPFYELLVMTATISITCPSCKKHMTGPAAIQGKKIKCKACSHIFVAGGEAAAAPAAKGAAPEAKGAAKAPAPAAKTKGNAAPAAKPKVVADKNRMLDPEDATPGVGYGFIEKPPDAIARCPQCAYEMETLDAVVCLTCGYNLLTRTRLQTQKTYELKFMDWVWWLIPPFGAVLGCLACIGFGIFLWTGLVWWYGDEWYAHFSLRIWFSVFAAAGAWSSGKYAFKRLVYQFRPPEVVKRT